MAEATDGPAGGDTPPVRRLLDPSTAPRLGGVATPYPTLYLANRLLVHGYPRSDRALQLDQFGDALSKQGLGYRLTDQTERRLRRSREVTRAFDLDVLDSIWVSSVEVLPGEGQVVPDAWLVLQRLRQSDPDVGRRVSLEHVIHPAGGHWGGIGGHWGGVGGHWGGVGGHWDGVGGHWGGVGGHWGGVGALLAEYTVPGLGGRTPVSVALPDPAERATSLPRPPVVVIPDTEVARHPWFVDDKRVVRLRLEGGELVPDSDPKPGIGLTNDQVGLRQQLEGHGTFIAGLIRQGCPEAVIVAIPVMDDDGNAEESHVLEVLTALLDRHVGGQQADGDPSHVVDVLSLSMGYYAEDDDYATSPVATILGRFAEHGVLVTAGVGNDATSAPFLPAALAADPPPRITKTSRPPVASVGATNPSGASVALFSNDLANVSALRPGVALVSTMPPVNGSGQPSVAVAPEQQRPRTTMDPDDYTGGFGIWSGTSFATPVLAAELATDLVVQGGLEDVSDAAMRKRAIRALRTCLGRSAT